MTTMPDTTTATVNADSLESLNTPASVEDTSSSPLPFPDEPAPAVAEDSTEPAAPAAEEPTAPAANWDADDNPYRRQAEEMRQQLEAAKPYLAQIEAARAAQEAAAIQEIVNKIEAVSQDSASPLSDQEKMAVQAAIASALEYEKTKPVIQQERMAGAAINYAGRMLGDNATIGELKRAAADLMRRFPDQSRMEAYVAAREEYNRELQTLKQRNAATQRVASGVDNVAPSPTQSGAMTSLDDFENAIYRGVSLTEKQWENYRALRRQRGLD